MLAEPSVNCAGTLTCTGSRDAPGDTATPAAQERLLVQTHPLPCAVAPGGAESSNDQSLSLSPVPPLRTITS